MTSGCVYDCRHPLWGGQGLCSSGHADPSISYTCSCDEGYLHEDSDGNPSCVLKSALVGIYATVAVVSFGASVFLIWQAKGQSRLPTSSIQLRRRAVLRLRVIMASSFASWTSTILFSFAAVRAVDNAALRRSHMLHGVYLTTMPGIASVPPFILAIWIEGLPSQLLPADSIAIKLKELVKNRFVLVQMSISGLLVCWVVGVTSFFFLDIVKAARKTDAIISFMAAFVGSGLIAFAIYLTVIINRAKNKAAPPSSSSRVFYVRAVKNVWTQVIVLSTSAFGQIVAAGMLTFNHTGKRTPGVLYAALVINAILAFCLSIQFSKLGNEAAPPHASSAKKMMQRTREPLLPTSTVCDSKQAGNGEHEQASSAGHSLGSAFRVLPINE